LTIKIIGSIIKGSGVSFLELKTCTFYRENAMAFREVSKLPVLEQSRLLQLPEIPVGKAVVSGNTSWSHAEKEFVAGCLIMACAQKREWGPVSEKELLEQIKTHPLIFPQLAPGVVSALLAFIDDALVEPVRFKGENYFIPTPRLVQTFFEGKVGLMDKSP
jgi:hypothetical protein